MLIHTMEYIMYAIYHTNSDIKQMQVERNVYTYSKRFVSYKNKIERIDEFEFIPPQGKL
jgi:hypothetical protein